MNIIKEKDRERITEENYNLIHHRAHSFNRTTGINYDDLFSVASLGFVKALNSYNSKSNTKFSTYAYNCMNNELNDYIDKEKRYRKTFVVVREVFFDN